MGHQLTKATKRLCQVSGSGEFQVCGRKFGMHCHGNNARAATSHVHFSISWAHKCTDLLMKTNTAWKACMSREKGYKT
jgi:hypothetical protein